MNTLDRRTFLATVSCSMAGFASAPLFPVQLNLSEFAGQCLEDSHNNLPVCWLDIAAPFIVEDAELGIHSEIVLTSNTFAGSAGHVESENATEYEIYLYDASGQAVGTNGLARRIVVKALNTTVIPVRELIGEQTKFWGGLKIRLRPAGQQKLHATDLFSSAFVRWYTAQSFDAIHANPDPLQWQTSDSYFYSMPFPALDQYECVFSLFNPNNISSAGELTATDSLGKRIASRRYELKPHASLLFDVNAGKVISNPWSSDKTAKPGTGGLLSVVNDSGTAKGFGFMMIRRNAQKRFSVEHMIHQSVFKQTPPVAPFDDKNQFKAKNVLYTPLLFHNKKLTANNEHLTLESRFHLGAGLPLEESLWLYPFAVNAKGEAVWSALADPKITRALPEQTERGVIRLKAHQSCMLDFNQLSLPIGFSSGGLAVAVSPDTNHTLFKVEVRIPEWNAHAFTHFRPGLRSARLYQKPKERGGLATDYITSGARITRRNQTITFDELICVINIDDRGLEARPKLELFGSKGLAARIALKPIPPFACHQFLLTEVLEGDGNNELLSLRLVDDQATLLMSVVHIDHQRRDIALDHGSDRFSTFQDFICQ